MPNIAVFHPQVVHFVIAAAGLGILCRWLSLPGKFAWMDRAATFLIVLGTVAAWLAVRSGVEAHGVAERVPGAVRAVQVHEAQGLVTRNILFVVVGLELLSLLPPVAKVRKYVLVASAVVGAWAGTQIYQSGKLGGELVYSFAGGVGTRSGDTTDVNRALMAAMYHRAALSRTQKNDAGAAAEFALLASRFPQDQTAQIMGVESLILDTKEYAAALAAISRIVAPDDTARNYRRYHLARADAYLGLGKKDSARMILEPLFTKAPTNKALLDRMEKAK